MRSASPNKKLILTFDAQSGEVMPMNKVVTHDLLYGPLPTPKRSGYVFLDWFFDFGGTGITITAETRVNKATNHTISAKWLLANKNPNSPSIPNNKPLEITIPPTSMLGIFMQQTSDEFPNQIDGIYSNPFELSPTPNIPNGFQSNEWGDSIENVKKTLTSKIIRTTNDVNYTTLYVQEQKRLLCYSFHKTKGLSSVVNVYKGGHGKVHLKLDENVSEIKAPDLLLALLKQFGKVPESNILETEGPQRRNHRITWMNDRTVIQYIDMYDDRQFLYVAPQLVVTFSARWECNRAWADELVSFSKNYLPQHGRVPYLDNELAWGSTSEDFSKLKPTRGIKYAPNETQFVYDHSGKLSACICQFLPETEKVATEVLHKLKCILGEGKDYQPSVVPMGSEVLFSQQWNTWDEIETRYQIIKNGSLFVPILSFGKSDFMKNYDYLSERGKAINKDFKF